MLQDNANCSTEYCFIRSFSTFNSTSLGLLASNCDVVYLTLYIAHHVSSDVLICDDAAHERRRTEAAAEEDAFDVVTLAD